MDEADPPAVVAQVGRGKAGGDRQAEVGQGQVAGRTGGRVHDVDQAGRPGLPAQVEGPPHGRRLEPIVVAGQDDRADPGAREAGQAGRHAVDELPG